MGRKDNITPFCDIFLQFLLTAADYKGIWNCPLPKPSRQMVRSSHVHLFRGTGSLASKNRMGIEVIHLDT